MKTSEKVKAIMEFKNLNYRSLGLKVGYSDVQIRNIIKKGQIPKIDFVRSLIRVFSDINPLYFFSDDAEMLINSNILHEPQSHYGNENLLDKIKILEGTITLKDSLLSVQEKYIKKLEEDLERLNGTQKNKSAV